VSRPADQSAPIRDTVIRSFWGIEGYTYVARPDLLGDCFDERAHAHLFTAREADAWIKARSGRGLELGPEDFTIEIIDPRASATASAPAQ
jgi:hypothetical protein